MKLASAVVIGGAASLCLRRALSDPGTSKHASAGGSPSGPSPVTPTSTTAPSTPSVTAVRRTRLDEGAAQAEASPERPEAEPDEAKGTKPKGQISSTGMRRTKSDAGTLPSIFY